MNKLEILQSRLSGIADCGIIEDDINRRYFTGMKSSAGTLVVFPEKSYLLIDFRYIEKARSTVKDCEVMLNNSGTAGTCKTVAELMDRHGAKSYALDDFTCTLENFKTYKKALGERKPVADSRFGKLIREIRSVKTADEIEKMIRAQRVAEAGLEHMMGFIRPGRTEKEIQLELDYYMLSHGAEALSFDTIALAGSNTSLPHGVPGDKRVESGEFVLMDFGAVVEGYHSDMTRTVCVGRPSDEMKKVYEIVLRAQEAAIAGLKAGITGANFDAIARNIIEAEGYGDCFGHSLGHGVGMEIHEEPYGTPRNPQPLPEGAVETIEPGIYLEGRFGVRIEDFAVVEKDGCKNLTLAPKELICL